MRFRNIAVAVCALLIGGLLTSAPAAESIPVLSPGELGVAGALNWGMTAAEVKRLFPGINPVPDAGQGVEPKDDPKLATVATDSVNYRGCSLGFTFRFFRDRLDQFRVASNDSASCHDAIERPLIERFRDHNAFACPNVIHREWTDGVSAVIYDYTCTGALGALGIQFVARADIAGRVADESRFVRCQSITFDILPAQNSDAASDPVLVPDLPDFGCDPDYYPPVSFRLQEQGTVQLDLRIASDGSIADAMLSKSSGKSRLDDGALRLARRKLKFVPAARDGMSVEVARQVAVSFRLLHFIHGSPDFIIRCEGGQIVLPGPCHPPLLAIQEAPSKAGAKLTVTSRNFRNGDNLDDRFTVRGEDMSPEISWSRGPRGTRSYVMIAEDPDVVGPMTNTVVHWIVYDIPASARELPQAISTDAKIANPAGAINAYNFINQRPGYAGYVAYSWRPVVHFQVFALDRALQLDPATSKRSDLVNAMKGHVLASGQIIATVNQEARAPECRVRSC